jgi:hypothetical protein
MSGDLMQLVAYGAQDIYLTGSGDFNWPYQPAIRQRQEPEPPTDRPLPPNRKEDPCPITFEPFNPADIYAECSQCHHCFHSDAIRQSLDRVGWKCPMCRATWEDRLVLYKVPFVAG